MKSKKLLLISIILVTMTFSQTIFKGGEVRLLPRLLNYQGYLTDTLGNPITNSSLSLSFAIFNAISSGNQKWTETQPSVSVDKGIFNVLLGSVTLIPDSVFLNSTDRWLELTAAGQTLTPRTRIVSAPYSYTSTYSDTAVYARNSVPDNDWVISGTNMYSGVSGNVGIGTTGPSAKLDVNGTARMTGFVLPAGAASGYVLTSNGSGTGTWQAAAADNDWIINGNRMYVGGTYGLSMRSGNVMHGENNYNHVNFGTACTTGASPSYNSYCTVSGGAYNTAAGVNSTVAGGNTNNAKGHSTTISGGFMNATTYDYAVIGGGCLNSADYCATVSGGLNNHAIDYYAVVSGGTQNTANNDYAVVSGGLDDTASGVYSTVGGGQHNVAAFTHTVVSGGFNNRASNFYSTVTGGFMNNASGVCSAVAGGYANTATAENALAANSNSNAVHDNSTAFNGQTTTATGQTRVGALSKASGTFTIDHPLDPENKILNHYFVESPEMVLIYRGIATIGDDGRCEVHLPNYYDALNEKPQIQLTGVGTYEIFIVENVKNNRFVIGGKPGIEVHWTVTGARKDPSAEITKIIMPVEQPKEGGLIGRSLDDEFLVSTMAQLERMGKASGFKFRHAAGQKRYEEMKRMLEMNK